MSKNKIGNRVSRLFLIFSFILIIYLHQSNRVCWATATWSAAQGTESTTDVFLALQYYNGTDILGLLHPLTNVRHVFFYFCFVVPILYYIGFGVCFYCRTTKEDTGSGNDNKGDIKVSMLPHDNVRHNLFCFALFLVFALITPGVCFQSQNQHQAFSCRPSTMSTCNWGQGDSTVQCLLDQGSSMIPLDAGVGSVLIFDPASKTYFKMLLNLIQFLCFVVQTDGFKLKVLWMW